MARPPAKIRVNTLASFPSMVLGSGPITISKNNGVWSVGFSVTAFAVTVPPPANYATDYLLGYDSIAKSFFSISISELLAAAYAAPAFDTAAGTYTVTNETVLLVNKTVPAASNIQLPAASTRNGSPLIIKDFAGNAASFNATIIPNGAETIDGLASLTLNANYGAFKLVPVQTGNWYISP